MKPIRWLGDSLNIVRACSPDVRNRVGTELRYVQQGDMPSDWKPMPAVGAGVQEIRIRLGNQYRVFYVAKFAESVYVLHVFTKKTQQTARQDIELGKRRYRELIAERRGK
jgi:phage-related protein